jgi:hypothetical protein
LSQVRSPAPIRLRKASLNAVFILFIVKILYSYKLWNGIPYR